MQFKAEKEKTKNEKPNSQGFLLILFILSKLPERERKGEVQAKTRSSARKTGPSMQQRELPRTVFWMQA